MFRQVDVLGPGQRGHREDASLMRPHPRRSCQGKYMINKTFISLHGFQL